LSLAASASIGNIKIPVISAMRTLTLYVIFHTSLGHSVDPSEN
jgi:hypothetical protein